MFDVYLYFKMYEFGYPSLCSQRENQPEASSVEASWLIIWSLLSALAVYCARPKSTILIFCIYDTPRGNEPPRTVDEVFARTSPVLQTRFTNMNKHIWVRHTVTKRLFHWRRLSDVKSISNPTVGISIILLQFLQKWKSA